MTPYAYGNSAPEGRPAGSEMLAEQLGKRSLELCRKFVLEMAVAEM